MKYLTTILFFLCFNASATTYYVSAAGSDGANGTSTGTPFLTITHALSVAVAGDNVLLKKGDVFNESINIPTSGTAGNLITIGAYGTGNKPEITGFQTASGFTNVGNVWTTTISNSVPNQNAILINGIIAHKARFPNSGVLFLTTGGSTTTRIKTTTLTGTPDYTGGEAAIRILNFMTDVSKISSQSVDTLFLATALTYAPTPIYPGGAVGVYWLQNLPSLIDTVGEYSYNETTHELSVYATSIPDVQYSTIDTLVYLQNKNYITFDGINFTGSNNKGIRFDTCRNITIQNCTFNNNGADAIFGRESDQPTITGDTILNSLNLAIEIARHGDTVIISDCYIKNTGILNGMGANGNAAGHAIYVDGNKNTILRNKLINTGYSPISYGGINSLLENNFIDSFCLIKDDGGGIYASGNFLCSNSYIQNNIITNGIGVYVTAAGIYLDDADGAQFLPLSIISNTIYNTKDQGIFLNSATNIVLTDNTVSVSRAIPFYTGGTENRHQISRNIFYQTDTLKAAWFSVHSSYFATTIDSDYVLRPRKDTLKYGLVNNSAVNQHGQAAFTALTGWEAHAYGTPSGITSAAGILITNPTMSTVVRGIDGLYIDAKGVQHNNSVTIGAFQSILLFKADHEIPAIHSIGNLIFSS